MSSSIAQRFTFIANALDGDGVFRPSVVYDASGKAIGINARSALIQYPRESDEKFARRNELAWYENHLASACSRFVGYLAKKPPLRSINDKLLEMVAEDCNWRGDDIDVFWLSFMVQAKARGSMLLLVDMPKASAPGKPPAPSLAAQIKDRVVPYFVPLKPEAVSSFEMDIRGNISRLEINTTHDGKAAKKGWDGNEWWITVDGKKVDGDVHGLGVCPVLAFSESGEYPHVGVFGQIADISKRLFNARSELDEILRAQTFSLLHYHIPPEQVDFDAKKVAEAIGTHNMLIHRGDAPGFIAPPDGPATVYLETIGKLEEAIRRVGLDVESDKRNANESGVALQIRFQELNSALTDFARRMEDFECRVWDVASRWLKLSEGKVEVEWAKDFQIADIKTELETLGSMNAEGFPDSAIRQQKRQVAALVFSTAEQETVQKILDDIDGGAVEVPAGGQGGLDPFGNSNDGAGDGAGAASQ